MLLLKLNHIVPLNTSDSIIKLKNGTYTKLLTDKGEVIWSIQKPVSGIIIIRRSSSSRWVVNITGQSNLQGDLQLLQRTDDGNEVRFQGNPIIGHKYTAVINMHDLKNNNIECGRISLTDTDGTEFYTHDASHRSTLLDIVCSITFMMPNKPFKVAVIGLDEKKIKFKRKFSTKIVPLDVDLLVDTEEDDLPVGSNRNISYRVHNIGSTSQSFVVSITIFGEITVNGLTSKTIVVESNITVDGNFVIQGKKIGLAHYILKVQDTKTGEVKQEKSYKVAIIEAGKPECHVVSQNLTCPPSSLNTVNCSRIGWGSVVVIDFSNTNLQSITTTAGSSVVLVYNNFRSLNQGPLVVNMSGTCCTPSVSVNVINKAGFIGQCHLSFSNGEQIESLEPIVEATEDRKNGSKYLLPVCLSTALAFGIVLTIVVLTTILKRKKLSKTKVSSFPNKTK